MLIGNYSVLNKMIGRTISGSTLNDRASSGKNGNIRGFLLSAPRASIPLGATSPTSWALATKSGGIASFTGTKGAGNLANLNLAGGMNGTAALTGTGNITNAGIVYIIVASAALTGNGAIAAAIKGALSLESNLVGAGALSSDLVGALSATASLAGSGDLSGDLAGALQAVANLLGSGEVSADVTGSIQMISNLSGNGDVSQAAATLIWKMVADLAGSSNATASVVALGNTIAALQGNGELTGAPRATAGVSSDITVTGDLLTTSNVGAAVRDTLLQDLDTINEGVQKASLGIPHSVDLTN